MVSKFLMRSILAVSLVFFMGTAAWATISGTSTTQTSCTAKNHLLGLCSIQVEGLLKQLGNVTNNPTAFAAELLIQKGTVVFRNPAGNSAQSEGVPFVTQGFDLQGAVPLDANKVSKNGRALADVVFHDPQLVQGVIDGLTALCNDVTNPNRQADCDTLAQIQDAAARHPNWVQSVVVTQLQVLGTQWVDRDTTDPSCDLSDQNPDPNIVTIVIDEAACAPRVDAEGSNCVAPTAVVTDPVTYTWTAFTYFCTDFCHDTDKILGLCPDHL